MCAVTDLYIKMNNNEDAKSAAVIIKKIASRRVPESANEINNFLAGIIVEENTLTVEDNYSLMSSTFRELIPQIVTQIAEFHFGSISLEAYYQSFNCGYEAEFSGQIYENGEFKISFNEHE